MTVLAAIFAVGAFWGLKLKGPAETPKNLAKGGYTRDNNPVLHVLNGTKNGAIVSGPDITSPHLGAYSCLKFDACRDTQ